MRPVARLQTVQLVRAHQAEALGTGEDVGGANLVVRRKGRLNGCRNDRRVRGTRVEVSVRREG